MSFQINSYPALISRASACLHVSTSASDSDTETQRSSLSIAPSIVLDAIRETNGDAKTWAEMFGFEGKTEESFYNLFSAIKKLNADDATPLLGLRGLPFYLSSDDCDDLKFSNFFSFNDLSIALKEDFLDADRGSTDNKKGWTLNRVSTPRDSSFEGARMNLDQVNAAMDKGTVIFNAIGAHIPKLASATLACTDATSLPNAVNMYVTAAGKKTSAPPHTDRQDVVVVQTTGKKHWRVYSPPNPVLKPSADMYARGKGDDNLPLFALEDFGCQKLLDVTLHAGDILFIPAGFPHTTDTVNTSDGDGEEHSDDEQTSIHLTFNLDTHVWDLDYLSMRRLALKRAGVADPTLEQTRDEDNKYVGKVNTLQKDVREGLLEALPLGMLEDDETAQSMIDEVTSELARISHEVDESSAKLAEAYSSDIWKDTVERVRSQGIDLFDIHRDMYLAAIEEGEIRKTEADMTAHLEEASPAPMTPERMQRLSLFRVQRFFEKIAESKEALSAWSKEGKATSEGSADELPTNWEFTLPVKLGDKVEANFGGAWFPATITKVGATYDVQFFDGDSEAGLDRSLLKLLTPPPKDNGDGTVINGVDTSNMTKKELKRFLKKQKKK